MTDQTRQQTGNTTPEDDIRELYSRVAKLNDQSAALLNPSWGSETGIIPPDHPLYVGEKLHTAQEEQGAAIDWEAIVRQRERELKEVGEARHRAELRLRLAHEERRTKEQQLDGIRRAMCDAGLMQDDDPYSHADLEDVIRQTATSPAAIDQPTPAPTDTLRQRIADAVDDAWRKSLETHAFGPRARAEIADAVLAVVQPELDRLQADMDQLEEGTVGDLNEANINLHRKAVRRALKISKLQGTLAAITDLASEQITARTEWGDGYRAALADLQEVLREFGPPAPDPEVVEPATITDPAWLREQYVGAMLDVIEPFRALVKPEAIRIADELATAVMGVRDRHLDQLRQRLQLADELPTLGQPPAPDAGPTVREAAADDRRWPLQKHGE